MPGHNDIVMESHEDRLQRLEADFPTIAANVATLSTQMTYVQASVVSSKNELAHKLDKLQETIESHATESAQRMGGVADRVVGLEKKNDETAAGLVLSKTNSEKRWKLIKQMSIPIAIAGTAIITKAAEAIYSWITG